MTQWLEYNDTATIIVGPFVDQSNGYVPETGLAAGTVDEIGVYKHNATSLTDLSSTTTFTHQAGGMYSMTLSATDTNTVGRLTVYVRDDDVCLPVWKEFMVLPANVFDSFVLGTDYLQTDLTQWLGVAPLALTSQRVNSNVGAMAANVLTATAINADAITAAKIQADAIGASEFAQAAADKVWATAARALTDKAGFSISGTKQTLDALNDIPQSAILSDATPFAGGNIDATISSRSDFDETTDPVELIDSGGTAGTSAAELVADIYAESISEPGTETPATPQTVSKIFGFLYKGFRNQKEETATSWRLRNDDLTGGQQATVSDDGTTLTKTELVSG